VTRKIKTLMGIATTVACSMAMLASCGPSVPVVPEGDGGSVTFGDAGPDSLSPGDSGQDTGDSGYTYYDSSIPDAGFNFWSPGYGPIVYWGGPILTDVPNLYIIWYGDWSDSGTPAIIEDMVTSYGGTPYAQIMTGYYQTPQPEGGPIDAGNSEAGDGVPQPPDASGLPKSYASGNFNLVKAIHVGYSRGMNLVSGDVPGIVTDALKAGTLPVDTNALYYVLTSADVSETSDIGGFCSDYCGYHITTTYQGSVVKYAFIGDPSNCIAGCTVPGAMGLYSVGPDSGAPLAPNGNWGADSMVSIMTHELCEATTDPRPVDDIAWQDQYQASEIGDMCAWRFEPVYRTPSGAIANVRWGDRDYLVQQMWVNGPDGGGCALHQ